MTQEMEKKPVEDTEEEVLDEETVEEADDQDTEDVEETETETTEDDDDIDYEAELEALKENKKHNFNNAKARIEKKSKTQSIDVDEIVERVSGEITKKFSDDLLERELDKISNLKKRELVRYHYENSIVRTGITRQARYRDW